MSGSRRLARTVAVVTASVALLAAPVATGSSYAAGEARAGTAPVARAAATDADGDGVPDAGDGCPTVAASTATGCPTASRRAGLSWVRSARRLEARISSPVTACSARARIVLWRVRPGQDVKVTAVTAAFSGRRRFTVSRGADYYVTVSPSYSPGVAECARATSRVVRVPRA